MVDCMEIGGVGHPRLIPILPTTSKIDLLYEYVICAVATQGAYGIDEWTTKYKILLSMDGTTMVTCVSIKFMCIYMYISKQAKSM